MFWLSSMLHRNYLTDGLDSTLWTSPPGLVSCAGTMVSTIQLYEKNWYCVTILSSISGKPVIFGEFTCLFRLSAVIPHSSILHPGWDETPGSCGPVVGLFGASLVSRSPALQFQDLRVFFILDRGHRLLRKVHGYLRMSIY